MRLYNEIVGNVVHLSGKQLDKQHEGKEKFRNFFKIFFSIFISAQVVVLVVLLFFRGLCATFYVSDTLMTSYIVPVFVETLGVVAVMVRFAFDTTQEIQILSTLNGVIQRFPKYKK